ncbi:hypothetical protein AC244_29870 [Ensifer adhaerens]|uniref:Uncharacterized protein n=1 Tax=Ensifer adhaerens TaxID=106592 RepID=A0A0L8BGB9_ENSAD|nr:hypothetical protein [Ensifer adhaerens]KOF13717.1 hypothetical protein AC244_29870 [Ensifer adhaerens]
MSAHRFAVGLSVRLRHRSHISPNAAETYRITAIMPVRDSQPQYRIRNDELGQDRVSKEENLEPIEWGMPRH